MKTIPSTRDSRNFCLPGWGLRAMAMFLLFTLAIAAAACGASKESANAKSTPANGSQAGLFEVPANQMGHLQVVPAQKTNWSVTVRTTGTVDWDNDHTTQAITQVSGPITRLLVDTGTYVKAGQPLLEVASPDLTGDIAAYRVARNRLNLAMLTLNRSRDLLAHHAIAQRDLESAEADYNDAATQVQNSLQPLRILGISQKQIESADRQNVPINPEIFVRAPIAGTVVQKLVLPGQFIQAGATTCFLISHTSTVWVQGHIYEKDLTAIRMGDEVDETNASFPQTFHGKVTYIGAMLDPTTRTTPVRIVTRNPSGLLKKDLFMDIVIHTGTRQNVLTVPTSAVLYNSDNEPFVYVKQGANQFAQRLVNVGAQQNGRTEILTGLQEGDQVVGEGSLFLQFANSYQR